MLEILNRTYLRTPQEGRDWLARVPSENLRTIARAGKIGGSLQLIPVGQWFGGRKVPMTGIASVGVDPDVRATGLASEMLRCALDELHSAGVCLSTLYPSTLGVYRRAGWELAGTSQWYRVSARHIDVRDREMEVRRLEDRDLPLVRKLYQRRASASSGHLGRNDLMWKRVLQGLGEDLHGYAVGSQGYVLFTQIRDKGRWTYDLRVRDLVATTPGSARRIWTFFADHRSFAGDVIFPGGVSDPMLLVLGEQDWKAEDAWGWMTRIVDVPTALQARGYLASGEVHLDVRDVVCPWNSSRWVLEVSDGRGTVRKGGRGKVSTDIRGLAALYTGYLTAHELVATGLLDASHRDLSAATALFSGPPPWLPDFF